MKKKVILRGLIGVPVGIAIGFIIVVGVSIGIGDGAYHPAMPELIEAMGNELNAVILQAVLTGVIGAGFAMASVVWEMDSWSLAKQTGIYFAISSAVFLPIAYAANWMQHSVGGVLTYVAIFIGIFIVIWVSQYFVWKSRVKKMNDRVRQSDEK